MKPEKWIGSKYWGFLNKVSNKEYLNLLDVNFVYELQIYTCTGYEWNNYAGAYKGCKVYKYKQSAIRYIKNNF